MAAPLFSFLFDIMFRRFLISLIATAVAIAAVAGVPQQGAVNRFVDSKALAHATVGVCVMDIETGEVLAGVNVDKGIISASTMKVVTSASALELLGKDFLFHTCAYAVGDIDVDGRLTGKILVVGGGDPTLGSRFFKDRTAFVDTLVMQVKLAGITSIDGGIEFDETAIPYQPVPGYWMVEDIAENYGAGYHAVNFADNQMKVKFDFNRDGTYSASTVPAMPWLDLRCRLRQQLPGDTMNRPGVTSRIYYGDKSFEIAGIVGRRKRGREDFAAWYANPAPTQLLKDSIERALRSNGIAIVERAVKSVQTTDTLQLLDYTSPELSDILKSMMRRSDNMFAEAMLRALPADSGLPAITSNGVRMVNKLWKSKGLDIEELSMKDGSGLARNGWTTPRFLCGVLCSVYSDRYRLGVDYSQLLPLAGREGTVKSLLRKTSLRGKVSLKSGSMGGVQCYAGYYPASKPRYAVAVMVNNFTAKRSSVVAQVQALLVNLFGK